MTWIVLSSGGLYIALIIALWIGWEKLIPSPALNRIYSTFVSVVIPMRNEEQNMLNVLRGLICQHYPNNLFEIIVVDDHSTDRSLDEVFRCRNDLVRTFRLPTGISGKKKALQMGIENSRGTLILTTDADCFMGPDWVASHVSWFETYHPAMMLGPVCGKYQHPFSKMQALEMFGLLGSTAGATSLYHPVMCNGANLSFRKDVYPLIKQVYENQNVPSGDDMFVLQELKKKFPEEIHFIKSVGCIVRTQLPDTFGLFLKQRRRWAGKAVFYRDTDTIAVGLIVLFINLSLLIALAYGIMTANIFYFLLLFMIKCLIDLPFLYRITFFFDEKKLLRWFPFVQSFYFFYVCFTVFTSLTLPNAWKERAIKH